MLDSICLQKCSAEVLQFEPGSGIIEARYQVGVSATKKEDNYGSRTSPRKSGYYYAVLNYTDSLGKRKTKWISTGLTVKETKNAPKRS